MDDTLKTIATHLTPVEAHLAKNRLEVEEIQAVVCEVESNQWCWHMAIAFGGVKLLVAQSDGDRAKAILEAADMEWGFLPDDGQDDHDHTDAIARRASVAGLLGITILPIVLTGVSIWLIVRHGLLRNEIPGRMQWLVYAAIAFNGMAIVALGLCVFGLVPWESSSLPLVWDLATP